VKKVFVSTPPALPPGTGARVFDDERRLVFGLGFARGHHAALLARPVPEPSRPLLVLVGAALLGVVRRAAAKRRS
jgi:hypothetical protein